MVADMRRKEKGQKTMTIPTTAIYGRACSSQGNATQRALLRDYQGQRDGRWRQCVTTSDERIGVASNRAKGSFNAVVICIRHARVFKCIHASRMRPTRRCGLCACSGRPLENSKVHHLAFVLLVYDRVLELSRWSAALK